MQLKFRNGRQLLVFSFLLFALTLLFFQFKFDSYSVLLYLWGVEPVKIIPFVDLNILLFGIDCFRKGIDPYQTPYYTYGNTFNYPKVWSIFSTIPFFSQSYCIILGFVLVLSYLILSLKYLGNITIKNGFFLLPFIFSPAFILVLERGNSDLFVFILIGFAVENNNILLKSSLYYIGGLIKLYPFILVIDLFSCRESILWKKILSISILMVSIFAYILIYKDNITTVSVKTPRPYDYMCFGLETFPQYVYYNFSFKSLTRIRFVSYFSIFSIFIFYLRQILMSKNYFISDDKKGDGFIIGGLLLIGVYFIVKNSWEYRLVFLLFTLPQFYQWYLEKRKFVYFILFSIIICLWEHPLTKICSFLFHFKHFILFPFFLMWFVITFISAHIMAHFYYSIKKISFFSVIK